MKYKDPKLAKELEGTPKLLQEMAGWFAQLSWAHFNKEATVTRVFEAVGGSSGVHEAHRAVDFRDEHGGTLLYTSEEVKFLVSEMNRRFPRKDKKLSCIHHSFKGGPAHFHLQVGIPGVTEDIGALDCNAVNS